MFTLKPLGYRVLAEMIGVRKLPTKIVLPDKSEIDGINRWIVRELGEGATSALTGVKIAIEHVKVGDEICFDQRRCAEPMPPMLNGGKRFAFVEVEAIVGIISGESEFPPTPIAIARSMPKLAA